MSTFCSNNSRKQPLQKDADLLTLVRSYGKFKYVLFCYRIPPPEKATKAASLFFSSSSA